MLMKSPRSKISLARARVRRQRARELPLRAELFGIEQLARHAQFIAAQHTIVTGRASARLLTRLDQNEKVLRAFNRATLAVDQSRRVTPAAEWLLDNFYLIEEQIHLARRHLPRGYSRELPRLTDGPSAGLPRVHRLVPNGLFLATGGVVGRSHHVAPGLDRKSPACHHPADPRPPRAGSR